MVVYEILRTEKTREYTPSVFIETLTGIYVECAGYGFFKHPEITTPEKLQDHLKQMKKKGFKVKKTTHTAARIA